MRHTWIILFEAVGNAGTICVRVVRPALRQWFKSLSRALKLAHIY